MSSGIFIMGFTVTLDPDMSPEKAEAIMSYVAQQAGVTRVHPVVTGRASEAALKGFKEALMDRMLEYQKQSDD